MSGPVALAADTANKAVLSWDAAVILGQFVKRDFETVTKYEIRSSDSLDPWLSVIHDFYLNV